jgi:hypothetical protein
MYKSLKDNREFPLEFADYLLEFFAFFKSEISTL